MVHVPHSFMEVQVAEKGDRTVRDFTFPHTNGPDQDLRKISGPPSWQAETRIGPQLDPNWQIQGKSGRNKDQIR